MCVCCGVAVLCVVYTGVSVMNVVACQPSFDLHFDWGIVCTVARVHTNMSMMMAVRARESGRFRRLPCMRDSIGRSQKLLC